MPEGLGICETKFVSWWACNGGTAIQIRVSSIRNCDLIRTCRNSTFSTVDHLRWDLHQIISLAVSDGHLRRNPAELLVTPKSIQSRPKLVMTREEVNKCF